MSTIKFVPMEFFAQFALTQMRRLQARGAVGGRGGAACGRGALPARLFRAREHHWRTWRAVGGRRSLFVRLSRRRVPIVNAGRCRRGFPGAGTSLADVGRCLRAWGAVGAAFSSTGTSLADVESCWWAQVAVCTAFPARGAYCERWALSARLSGSGAGLAIVGSPFVRLSRRRVPIVNAGRCRRGFPGAGTSLADVESCWWAWGRCRRGFFWCVVAVGGRRSPLAGMRRCRRARGAVGAAFSSTGTSLADVESCWWAQVAVCGRRSAVGAAFSGARERRPVLRTPPPFRAAHGACRSACPLAARTHPSSMVRARRLPVGRTPPPFRAAHGACRSACPLAARPPPFRRAACRFAA